jgi:O-antigen ligase
MLSNSGFFNLMVRYASLNTVSAFNRVLIWQFGSRSVAEHPWFGIGYDDWDRPTWMQWDNSFSIDNFWLLIAMRFGLPVAVFLGIATLTAVGVLAWRSTRYQPADARLMRGMAISLGVFALGIISVALWLIALAWFFVLVGVAVSLAYQLEPKPTPRLAIARLPAP